MNSEAKDSGHGALKKAFWGKLKLDFGAGAKRI